MAPFDVEMVPLFTLQIKRCIPDVAGVGLSQVTLSANIKRLQTYWNGITSRLLDEQLMKAAEIDTLELWQKCVILILDEMSIHEDLVYDKHSGELIGYTNLGDINNHLLAFEKSLSDPGPPEIANSMLMFMVQGLFIPLQFPYCQFPCCSVTGDLLFKPIWEAVYRIERCGLQVHDPCTVW